MSSPSLNFAGPESMLPTMPLTMNLDGDNSTKFPSNSSMVSTTDNGVLKLQPFSPDFDFVKIPSMADMITTTTEPGWLILGLEAWIFLVMLGILIIFCVCALICCCCYKIAEAKEKKKKAAKEREQNDAIQQARAAAIAAQTAKNQAPPPQLLAPVPAKPAQRAMNVIEIETVIERDTKILPDGRQIQSVKITKTSSEKSKEKHRRHHKNHHKSHHEIQLPPPLTSRRQENIFQVDPSSRRQETQLPPPLTSRRQQSIVQIDPLPVAPPVYTPVYTPVYQPTPYPPQPSQLQPQPESYSQQSSSQQ